jgi:hypothetical protein
MLTGQSLDGMLHATPRDAPNHILPHSQRPTRAKARMLGPWGAIRIKSIRSDGIIHSEQRASTVLDCVLRLWQNVRRAPPRCRGIPRWCTQ